MIVIFAVYFGSQSSNSSFAATAVIDQIEPVAMLVHVVPNETYDMFDPVDLGTAEALHAGRDEAGINSNIRSALKFDLSGYEIKGPITEAVLSFEVISYDGGDPHFRIEGAATDSWDASQFPGPNGVTNDFVRNQTNTPSDGIREIDVTAIVQDGIGESDRIVSFVVIGNETGGHNMVLLGGGGNYAMPKLKITYSYNSAPQLNAISINAGAEYSNSAMVNVTIDGSDADGDDLQVGFSENGTDYAWQNFVSSPVEYTFNNSSDGTKSLHVKLRDDSLEESVALTDTIVLDTTAPVVGGVADGGAYNTDRTIAITETNPDSVTLNGGAFTPGGTITAEGEYTLAARDLAGNEKTVTFTIDKTAPVMNGVADGAVYGSDRTATFTDETGVTAALNGAPYTEGGTIGEGAHTLTATDAAGNETTVTFTIDKTAPVVDGAEDGEFYNTDRSLTFTDLTAVTATLNGNAYTAGSAVSAEGGYTLAATDAAGNETTVVFTIDKTSPVVDGVTDGGVYNTDPTIVVTETHPGSVTLNGGMFTSGGTVTSEGDYTLIAADLAGNEIPVTFTIDKTAPVVDGAADGEFYNTDRSLTFTDLTAVTATLNGNAYTAGSAVSAEGGYTLVATDSAGNETTMTFTIDKTAPVVDGVTDGGVYNTDPTIVVTETHPGSVTLNGGVFTSGGTVTSEGDYTLIAADLAGNEKTVTFTIDKTAPVMNGVADGAVYGSDRTATFTDETGVTAALNGAPYTEGGTIGEGAHTLTAADAAGNETTVTFTIDKTAPVVDGAVDGEFYNTDRSLTFTDLTAVTATLNGNAYTAGSAVSAEGGYTLVATDAAGNETTVVFTIDKTAPVVDGVTDGGVYNTDPTIVVTETHPGSVTLNGGVFTSGGTVTSEGDYTLIAADLTGNEITVTFTIDKTAPVVDGAADGEFYNTGRSLTFTDLTAVTATLNGNAYTAGSAVSAEGEYTLAATDAAGNETMVVFTIDKTAPVVDGVTDGGVHNTDRTIAITETNPDSVTLNGGAFTPGETVTAEGEYTLAARDLAGNEKTVTFTIDKTAPMINGVANGAVYGSDRTATFTDETGVTAALNGAPYTEGGTIGEGAHTLTATDAAGNETTVTFTIDKTAPVVDGAVDGEFYNTDRSLTFTDLTAVTATLNGNAYTAGSAVSAEGGYTLVATDAAGNETTVVFTIDKTAPVVDGVTDGGVYNTDPTIVVTETHPGSVTLNGGVFTSGGTVTSEGDYTLIAADLAGNEITVTFTIDKTAPMINGVADGAVYDSDQTATFTDETGVTGALNGAPYVEGETIGEGVHTLTATDAAGNEITVTFTIDNTAPVVGGALDGEYYNTGRTLSFTDLSAVTASLNGSAYIAGTAISAEGEYTLVATDEAGNETTLMFTIDKTPPLVNGVAQGETYSSSRSISFNEGKAELNGQTFTNNSTVTNNGSYTLIVTDKAGNATKVEFTVAIPSPGSGYSNGSFYTPPAGIDAFVNGVLQPRVATVEIEEKDGKKTTTFKLNEENLTAILESEQKRPVVTIPVLNRSDTVVGLLDGSMVKAMESKNAVLEIKTEDVTYSLPARQIQINQVVRRLGNHINPQDLKLTVIVKSLNEDQVKFNAVNGGHIQLVAPPVEFIITASHNGVTVDVTRFQVFVERTIAIPDGIDPDKITTGVIITPDGEIKHVPTRVTHDGGRYYAVIRSLSNSVYAVIYNERSYADVQGHWSQIAVENLASRLVINGVDEDRFAPGESVSRAEFTSLLVRALGMHSSKGRNNFSDVAPEAWYAEAVSTAVDYGLISGYADGTFRPDRTITREEAMVVIARALPFAEYDTAEAEALGADHILELYMDKAQFHDWSKEAASYMAYYRIVQGYQGYLSPGNTITRAETAVLLQRFLQAAELI
ncbi:S-layer homology domain-containing protein [Paenibacillus tarimensis]